MFNQLLEKIAAALEKCGIPYMVIGGQAVLIYGEPRFTNDIDITLGVDSDKIDEVLSAVKDLSFTVLTENIKEFVKKTMVLPLKDPATNVRVDFIFSFSAFERYAIENAQAVLLDSRKVFFAKLEDIIIHKIVAGRARDIEDVKVIISKNPDYDKQYIIDWLKKFDETLNGDFADKFSNLTR